MKVIIFILIFYLIGNAQIVRQNSHTSVPLTSVYFINDSIGFTAGGKGVILKTIDGGKNWKATILDTTKPFRDIFFLNKNIGWAVGDFQNFYRTTNCGKSWQIVENELSDINSVFFIDSINGWVTTNYVYAGTGDGLYYTNDGGLNWERKIYGYFNQVYFIDSLGFCIDLEGHILKTTDLGTSRKEFYCGSNEVLNKIYFANINVGYVISGYSWLHKSIYKSTDSGESWTIKWQENDHSRLNSIWFFNENQGIVCGSTKDNKGRLLITNDGGNNWQKTDTLDNTLNDIYFINDSLGWTVGGNGTIYKLEKQIIVNVNEPSVSRSRDILALKVYPNPFNNQTSIKYIVPQDGNVRIVLFNTLGAKVIEFLDEYVTKGEHQMLFQTAKIATGVYLLLIEQNNHFFVKKIMLLK